MGGLASGLLAPVASQGGGGWGGGGWPRASSVWSQSMHIHKAARLSAVDKLTPRVCSQAHTAASPETGHGVLSQ